MGRPSKLSEEQWGALFDLDRAGVRRAVLAERFGVSVSTLTWQARKRGRMKTQAPLAVDHRRRPAEGWAPDHVFCQSKSGMTPERWGELIRRRNAGERDEALAAEYGVSVGRIADVAKEAGRRKCETAGAVFLPRGPSAGQNAGLGDFKRKIEVTTIEMDWARPAASVHDYDRRIVETLNGGDEVEASRMWKWRGRMAAMGGVTRRAAQELEGRVLEVAGALFPLGLLATCRTEEAFHPWGGEMVKAVFRAVGCEVPVKEVRAAIGKRARAEPVAALYERGRVRHAGVFAELEEELAAIGDEDEGSLSLDRADALVWAVTALLVREPARPRIRSLDTGWRPGGLSAPRVGR